MRSRTLQGITAALLTASALWLSGSPVMALPPAAAPTALDARLLDHLWQWLESLWRPEALAPQKEAASAPVLTPTEESEANMDRGAGIDPNGAL